MTLRREEYPGRSARALRARAEAFESAAGHLELDWTEDSEEFAEGLRLSRQWHSDAAGLRERAREIEGDPLTVGGLYGKAKP